MDTKRKMNYYDVNAIIAGVLYLYKNNYTQFSLDEYNEIATNLYDDYTPKQKYHYFEEYLYSESEQENIRKIIKQK